MDDNTILLNGGRSLDVTPVDGADQFLAQLLGAAPSKPAIPTLRLVDGPAGRACVGVFIGQTIVGYLAHDIDSGLAATLEACEHHGAVARARATLMSSWEDPEVAVLKVDLAESDHLLTQPPDVGNPPPDAPLAQQATELPPPADLPEPESAPAQSSGFLENESAPALSAGFAQDYPDWPPRKSADAPAFGAAPAAPAPTYPAPSAEPEPLAPPGALADASAPVAPGPPASPSTPAPATPSTQTPAATRSAWMGAVPMPGAAPQAGWLSASPSQRPLGQPQQYAQPAPSGQALPPQGTGWLGAQRPAGDSSQSATGGASAPAPGDDSWQDHADRPRDPESQFVTGWTSGTAQPQAVSHIKPAGMSDKAKAYLVGVLAAVVMITAGFLVWKTMFASKTYTDAQYGYSFSYPGRWECLDEGDMFPYASLAALGANPGTMVDFTMAGHGNSENDMAAIAVCVFDIRTLPLEASQIQAEFETNLALAVSQDPSIALVEPVTPATFGGVPGYRCAVSMTYMGFSLTFAYGMVVDGNLLYALIGLAPEANWSDNKGAVDHFFDSFKPGATRI